MANEKFNVVGTNIAEKAMVRLGICTPVVSLFPQKYRIL